MSIKDIAHLLRLLTDWMIELECCSKFSSRMDEYIRVCGTAIDLLNELIRRGMVALPIDKNLVKRGGETEVIDDKFVAAFMQDDPDAGKELPGGLADKPTYTRAEVDQIVQDTIKSTMAAMQGQPAEQNDNDLEEKEDYNDGREESGEENGED